ncbi:MAG: substrate binding domain-containing protein [Acetobacteraceae bacterium]|nr:substrate binding domain-containing protein [Acetobacteraceae bacterium]
MTPRGKLRVHANTHLIRFLAPILAEYLALYAEVSLDLVTGERLADLIEDGYDLALRTVTPPDSGLIVRPLTPWRQVVCCAHSYLEAHGPLVHPSDLTQHNCLQYQFFPSGNEWRFVGPGNAPIAVRVAGNVVTTSAELLRALALAGSGVLIAPSFIVADDLACGALVPLFADYRLPEFAINAVYPHRRLLSAKVRCLIDLLVKRMTGHREWIEQTRSPI